MSGDREVNPCASPDSMGTRRAQTAHSLASSRDLIHPTARMYLHGIVQFDPIGGTLAHLCVAIFVEPQFNTGSGV